MKRTNITTVLYPLLLCALLSSLLSSCIKDDMKDCGGLEVQFRYTYNMKGGNAFGNETSHVRVYIFDDAGRFVSQHWEEGNHILNSFRMHLPSLPAGEYTLVAWARSTTETGEYANLEFPDLQPGTTLDDLTARVRRDNENSCRNRLNSLLNGTLKITVTGRPQTEIIDMLKCTNTIRVILMPYSAGQLLNAEDYEFRIEGKNGWLSYDASPYKEDALTYRPYYKETLNAPVESAISSAHVKGLPGTKAGTNAGGAITKAGNAIDNAVVAELNTSRLFYENNPRFIIRDRKNNQEVMNLNLTWFLSLQAIGEHEARWSNQEYLDRQDEYAMTFFIDGTTWLQTRIIVNGWVLSLEDIGLN